MIDMTSLTGMAAAFCTTLSFVPQVIQILRSGNTDGISLSMYSIFTLGVSLWMIYGVIREDLPIFIANGVTLLLTLTVLGLTVTKRIKGRTPSTKTPE